MAKETDPVSETECTELLFLYKDTLLVQTSLKNQYPENEDIY